MHPPALSRNTSSRTIRASDVHGSLDKVSAPGESVEELKRRVAVLDQEIQKEERARNYAELERVRQ